MAVSTLHSTLIRHAPLHWLPWRLPLRFAPVFVQKQAVEHILNQAFKEPLAWGELDFLEGKVLSIEITDLGYQWPLTLKNNQLIIQPDATADAYFKGESREFVLMASRREDPDTLFFQRKLSIEGDTELGLYVKNLIDSMELDTLPNWLLRGLSLTADLITVRSDAKGN